jgi:integrase
VVYNKSRATWNYLFVEGGKRKSRKLGTLSELPTKTDAIRRVEAINREMRLVAERRVPSVEQLVKGYKAERMPKRYSTSRSYKSWLDNYIVPRWGASPITDLKPRPVEQWMDSLELSPRSKGFIRSLVHAIWDYAMWSDAVPTQANPARLVRIEDVSKRQRQPHPLTISAFQIFVRQLDEPFRTIACVCVCFGLRISECLALRWSDINWLEGKLSIQRSIVRQRVGDVKTAYSKKTMPIDSEMLKVLETWRARTQFSADEDWVFASPAQLGRLPWSADGVNDAYRKATSAARIGHVTTHTMRHTYRSWLDAVGTSIAVQQKLMRHADIRTTMNVYGDVVTDEMEQAHSKVVRMALAPVN